MLYLQKNVDNTLMTDSVVDYIPTDLTVYLGTTLVGTFTNISTDKNYFILEIPSGSLTTLQNTEHKIKYIYHYETLKQELCVVKDQTTKATVQQYSKTKDVIIYEPSN